MKEMKKKIICIGIISMFLLTGLSAVSATKIVKGENEKIVLESPNFVCNDDYTDREKIEIDYDGFKGNSAVIGGSGTENDPYIIEGWRTPSITIEYCSNYYFIIRNCLIYDDNSRLPAAVYAGYSKKGVFENCILEFGGEGRGEMGFDISNSNINVYGCDITGYEMPLSAPFSSGSKVYHNNFYDNNVNMFVFCQMDNGKEGNYYDSYCGKDENEDGIGDTEYCIEGHFTDRYPLMKAWDRESIEPRTPYLDGPAMGETWRTYTYNVSSTDDDGHRVRYFFDWDGDGSIDERTNYFDSGVTAEVDHKWSKKGTYIVKVFARDVYGYESDWATFKVTMPRNKVLCSSSFDLILERLSDHYPLLNQLLQHFLNLPAFQQ